MQLNHFITYYILCYLIMDIPYPQRNLNDKKTNILLQMITLLQDE